MAANLSSSEDYLSEFFVAQYSITGNFLRRQGYPLAWGLIENSSTHAPAQECLDGLQSLVRCDGSPALFNGRDEFNYIPLADLMNAPAGPRLARLATKES
jgi:hypothetical protein